MTGYPPNFKPSEFDCKCGEHCDGPSAYPDRTRHLAWTLQRIRDELGAPVSINSAYRCPAHNKSVGGASRSLHLSGMAADIAVAGISSRFIADKIEELIKLGAIPNGGLGRYKTFTHVDIRENPARWGSND